MFSFAPAKPIRTATVCAVVLCLTCLVQSPAFSEEATFDFRRDVWPIFAENCLKCHGLDHERAGTDLRLDALESATRKLLSGKFAVVPGKSEASELLRRVQESGDDRMPPPEAGKALTPEQVDVLRHWIDNGATWEKHWAYRSVRRPHLPTVKQSSWPNNAIDHFTLAMMERKYLRPSTRATQEALIRRLSFDLTGLPPTPAEIDEYLADKRPDAYHRLVERLLASPHYGERMALMWMDLARYADTNGYHIDNARQMWRWRDWVIEAFNANMPFDQFTIEQLAGDLLPNPTLSQLIATGFNRNHMLNHEVGTIDEEYRLEYVMDRVVTTSTVWLGQTMICARCHDHKYDPFTQRDFYSLLAYFNNLDEKGFAGTKGNAPPMIDAPTRLQQKDLTRLDTELAKLTRQMKLRASQARTALAEWERNLGDGARLAAMPADVAKYYSFDEENGSQLTDRSPNKLHAHIHGDAFWGERDGDSAMLCTGETFLEVKDAPTWKKAAAFSIGLWVYPTTNDRMSLVSRWHDEIPRGVSFQLDQGKLQLELRHNKDEALLVASSAKLDPHKWHHVAVTYDGAKSPANVSLYVGGKRIRTETDTSTLAGTVEVDQPLLIGRRAKSLGFRGFIDELRIYGRSLDETEVAVMAGGNPISDILAIQRDRRTPEQMGRLIEYFLEHQDDHYMGLLATQRQLESARSVLASAIPTTMVMREMDQPRETRILNRGNYQYPGEPVPPTTPAHLPRLGDEPNNRLGLARWLVDPQNPLTARVMVNRLWKLHFGVGIVATEEDFGTRGEYPSHPELLDWLADEFVSSGWDIKHVQRLIVHSATYQQATRLTTTLAELDPKNRWLARFPRTPLMAEAVRDLAMQSSGLMVEELGGPSVKPYQPPGLWRDVSYNSVEFTAQTFVQDQGADLYRRGMYTFWKRSFPPPSMAIFGATGRETCTTSRPHTNTPFRALVLLNDPVYIEAARVLAHRLMNEGGDSARDRITLGFRLTASRRPTESEVAILTRSYKQQLANFREHPQDARDLLQVGDIENQVGFVATEHAAWTVSPPCCST